MSKTLFVNFRDRGRDLGTEGFWAFDVVVAVFLKHLVDAASSHQMVQNEGWLADAIEQWRFNALCGDCGLFLEDSWSDEQVATFNKLAREACQVLSKRENIPAQEIESWQIMDGNDDRCFARGLPFVTTESAIRLGEAIIKLVDGRLPAPPPATWWFFGTEESDLTMGRRGE